MLNHQAEFGIVLAEVYDANIGEPVGEVTPRRAQTAPESIQAVDDYQVVMREIRDLLLPEVVSEEVFLSPEFLLITNTGNCVAFRRHSNRPLD